ncbi:MAG: molybdopterin-guanine dinucleotide biosynthesis protein A [Cryomorphaceae bacterium]|jgi:molybdopterin-guanine dinucleotide biosynthesis protein A
MITAVLLVGGKSSRMGEAKSELIYQEDQSERVRLHGILDELCEKTYLCHREDQAYDQPGIIDPGNGPLAAIATAAQQHPENALLIIACDTPLLAKQDIQDLIGQRDRSAMATCYISPIDNKPEPFCAIYEPAFFPAIITAVENDQYCPRRLLEQHTTKNIPLTNPQALMNANSPAERIEVNAIINATRKMKTIELKYFAQLREIAQKDAESIQTESCTPAGLYEEIKQRYQFPHKQKHLMVAINEDFSSWDYLLQEGDEVVFIPPVAGG